MSSRNGRELRPPAAPEPGDSGLRREPGANGSGPAAREAGGPRSCAVVMVALVSASSGLMILAGATAAALAAAAAGLARGAFFIPVTGVAVAAGLAGVWAGIRLTARFCEPGGDARRGWSFAGGAAGLAGALVSAGTGYGAAVPVLLVLMPGAGAALGEAAGRKFGR